MKKNIARRKKGQESSRQRNEQRRTTVNLLFSGILCLCVLVLIFAVMIKKKESDSNGSYASSDQKKTETVVETKEQKYQAIEDICLDKKTGIARVHIANEASSSVYLKVTVGLENGEILYESELLKPGGVLEEIKIEKDISEGEYTVTISVDSYSLDSKQILNGVVYTRKLYVE